MNDPAASWLCIRMLIENGVAAVILQLVTQQRQKTLLFIALPSKATKSYS